MTVASRLNRNVRNVCVTCASVACLIIGTGVFDSAQNTTGRCFAVAPQFGANQTAVPSNEVTHFTGKLKGMRRGVVMVEKEDGSQAMVMPPDTISSFEFVAKATPAFLRRGMLVRFTGNFGPGGVPVSPITKVTLFQQVDVRSLNGRAKLNYTPGVHADAKPGQRNQPMMGKATIVGALVGLNQAGLLAVQAGKIPVRVQVSPDATLEIRYNSLALAREGDKVTVAGFYQPPNENQVKADRVTVTTDRVYGEAQPDTPKRSRRGKADDKDGDKDGDDGKGDAAEKADDEKDGKEEAGDTLEKAGADD